MASATGARNLVATRVLMCMLLCEAAAQNRLRSPQEQKTEHCLLINELNADNPGEDTSEFVELYHTSGREAPLDGYCLVFYNGNGNQAYKVLNLQGKVTDNQGFFLVGSSTVKPRPSVILPKNTIQNGPDAIALYYGEGSYQEGMRVTSEGLVDALVHKSRKSDRADVLLSVLTPSRDAFLEDPSFRTTDESIERCPGVGSQWVFQVATPTPGKENHCIPASLLNASAALISEVHAGSSPGESEFIELQGPPSTVLRDLVLVLIEGRTKEVYFCMDVYGKTSPEGLFLIGPAQARTPVDLPFPPNCSSPLRSAGPQAIALYVGNSNSFPVGTAASATNLVDALVYTRQGSADPELLEILTPGRPAHETHSHQPGNVSMSRCSCCSVTRDSSIFTLSSPTPGQFNDCPSSRFSQSVSLCLRVADCHWQLPGAREIQAALAQALDKLCRCGMSVVYLKGFLLEVYCGPRYGSAQVQLCGSSSPCVVTLQAARGTQNLTTSLPSARISGSLLTCGGGPARLLLGSWQGLKCNDGHEPVATCQSAELVFTGLLTAKSAAQLSSLGQAFSSFLESPGAAGFSSWNATVEKPCSKDANVTASPPGASSEGTSEPPSHPAQLLISEVNPDNPGGREDREYVELLSTGQTRFDLRGYWLVLYNGKTNQAYRVENLTGYHTNERGYFLVGGTGVTPRPVIVLPPNTIQNGGDAVALYHSTTRTYSVGMAVTEAGLVDAVVYKSRASDRADKLLKVLTPGQNILYEDNSYSSQDESLSRCNSQSARLHSSFQVTVTTPFGENACANASAPAPALLLNELSLANGTALFVELKGKPGAPLRGYTLVFYSGQDGKAYASIPLQGTIGATGLFVLAPAKAPGPDQEAPSARGGTRAVAVYSSSQVPISVGVLVTLENLVDALVYTWESSAGRGELSRLGPSHFVPYAEERLVSLSRCACCGARAELEYAVSDPTPGLENRCPLKSFAAALGLCLLTPNCSVWTAAPEGALHSLEGVLTKSIEENCACGVSQFYLHELNFTCTDSMLKLTGQVWAKSLEQQHLILDWHRNFTTSPHPFSVAGRVLKAKGKCAAPAGTVSTSPGGASFQAWEIALFVLGSVLLTLILVLVAIYYFKRHSLNYTTIEMNDRSQMAADF